MSIIPICDMESFMLFGFVGILREAPKILCKDGKLVASLSLLTILIYSLVHLFNVFSIKPFITDFIVKQSLLPVTDPKSPEFFLLLLGLREDIRAFVGLEWLFVLISTLVSFFFATATIIASAMIHGGRNFSFKELLFATVTSLKRPFFTWFYTTLLGLGYNFLVLANLLPMILVLQHPLSSRVLTIILSISAAVLYSYLAVIWNLALVVSVLDDKSGIGALGKAAQIVKGMQLHGFLLNLLFSVLYIVLLQGMRLMTIVKSTSLPIIIGLLLINSICLANMFLLITYTIYYYQCKKTHGEEVELQWKTGYSKVPSLPLLNENIP